MTNQSKTPKTALTYKDAGVDIDAGDAFIDAIKPLAKRTAREGVLDGLGGFGALFEVPKRIKNPILVSGTDGVGTKLKLAFDLDHHSTIGIDLVGMCVNDVIVQGAEPLFFLDYFATGKLAPAKAAEVVAGIAEGCVQANAALIGGETAEMPGMYQDGEYDLAGFCVGAVDKERIITGKNVQADDVLIGLASSGAHSNGYSLIRRVIETSNTSLDTLIEGVSLAERVMAPTKIYVKSLLKLIQEVNVSALAHITGGGIPGNLVRVLPDGCSAKVHQSTWQWPALFEWLQETGNIEQAEMYRTFNCGVGMILAVRPEDVTTALNILNDAGESAFVMGAIEADASTNSPRVLMLD